jgi:hypothetical protein
MTERPQGRLERLGSSRPSSSQPSASRPSSSHLSA